jgi:hypothetical protein
MSSDEQEERYESQSENENENFDDESMESEFVIEAPRKTISQSTLLILTLLAGVCGATYLMVVRSGPAKASAETAQQNDAAGQTINTFLGGGVNNIHIMELILQKTASVVARFRSYPGTQQVPLSDLQTNPFHFATLDNHKADVDDDTAKRLRNEQIEAAIAAARQLRLQSVLIGPLSKSCIIDGKFFTTGDKVGKFILREIKANSILIQADGLTLEVMMHPEQKP